ncbi:ribonuclease HIII [Psychrobacillus sp. Sa2BUA9]|uniref:Ribonuclease HIII n=1 Tax=Psychrobacillus faecigallinarum TaxID=2762235 RepID=A0ABR8R7K2_9BACI|nr:ribonuclease HIII [Psychrobacillus faecigallinarum]MBD7943625.1 ribonuclease HIII [Psychrobacillus faecigallinarum]
MSNEVLLLPANEIEKVKAHYLKFKIERSAPGVVFAAKLVDTAITIYKSGKVMFQGNGASREAALWSGNISPANPIKSSSSKGDILPENFTTLSVIGSDETGTGDYFGPITVAACYVPAHQVELVRELGVKDSKMLTDELMRRIAPDLMKTLSHSVLVLKNEKYNEIQGRGWSQGKIKAMMHNQALKHVLNKIEPEKPAYILIDQFAERGIYYNHIKMEKEIIRENVLFSTKAEQLHVSVAAASIIARYAFLKEMDRLTEIAHTTIPKGASAKVDETAAKIYFKHGEEFLKSITKWHFANTQKAMKLVQKRKF